MVMKGGSIHVHYRPKPIPWSPLSCLPQNSASQPPHETRKIRSQTQVPLRLPRAALSRMLATGLAKILPFYYLASYELAV